MQKKSIFSLSRLAFFTNCGKRAILVYMKLWASVKNSIRRAFYLLRKRRLGLSFPLYCKAHGVSANDYQGAIAQSRAGDPLQIVHTPKDEYPHNVYVYNVTLNRVLGYLDKTLAKRLIQLFGKGFVRDGYIENITGGQKRGYPYYGCNLRILESQEILRNCKDFSHLKE